jgi:hypothetical protein
VPVESSPSALSLFPSSFSYTLSRIFSAETLSALINASKTVFNVSREAAIKLVNSIPGKQKTVNVVSSAVTIAVIPSATLALPAVQNILFNIASFQDLTSLILRNITNFFSLLGLRKKRKYWGTVYDSITKQPLDPVIVRLIDAKSNKVVEEAITDLYGRYGFLTATGTFKIEVLKSHFTFPSKNVNGFTDQVYQNLYYGDEISVISKTDVINPNIPMDPIAYDFNQEAKKQMFKQNPIRDIFFSKFFRILFWFGLAFSLIAVLANPNTLNYSIAGIYIFVLTLSIILPKKHLWGEIVDQKDRPLKGIKLELNHPQLEGVVVGRAISNQEGKFLLKAERGHYNLKASNPQTEQVIKTEGVDIREDGVLNSLIRV